MHLTLLLLKSLIAGAVIAASVGDFPPADTGTDPHDVIHVVVQNNLPNKKNYRIVNIFVGSDDEDDQLQYTTFSDQLPDDGLPPGEPLVISAKFSTCQNRVDVVLENGEDYYSTLDICEPNPAIIVNTD